MFLKYTQPVLSVSVWHFKCFFFSLHHNSIESFNGCLWNSSLLLSSPSAPNPRDVNLRSFHAVVCSLLVPVGQRKKLLHKLSLPGISVWLIRGCQCRYQFRGVGGGGKQQDKNTPRGPGGTATGWPDGLLSDEKGQVEFERVRGFSNQLKAWVVQEFFSLFMVSLIFIKQMRSFVTVEK